MSQFFASGGQRINCMYTYSSSFFELPGHLGHHRTLSGVSCAVQRALIRHLTQSRVYVSAPISRFIPLPHPPCPVFTRPFSRSVSYFCLANKLLCITFLEPHASDFIQYLVLCVTYSTLYDSLWVHPNMWKLNDWPVIGVRGPRCLLYRCTFPVCAATVHSLYQYIHRAPSPLVTS